MRIEPAEAGGELLDALLVWLVAAGVALLGAAVALLAWLGRAVRDLERQSRRLERLDELAREVAKLAAERGDLDLKRIEHALIDLRDGQRRVEDGLVRAVSRPRADSPGAAPGDGFAAWAERIESRLLALGCERVELVTPREELEKLGREGGEVMVEARRDGVVHKGRVVIRDGRIAAVEVAPPFALFP
jgi:hypothetical protein